MCIVYLQEGEGHSIICALRRIGVLQNIHRQAQLLLEFRSFKGVLVWSEISFMIMC